MNEAWYDKEIAPVLLDLSKKCEANGVSLLAVVEYQQGERARTVTIAKDAGLEMRMLDFCARAGTNIDAYFIALVRYCREHGIRTDSSIVMNKLNA